MLLSWIERAGDLATLKFAERTPSGWSPPRTVATGSDWFVNWADVPSVLRLPDGTLVAHWLQKSGSDTYAYDVRLVRSADKGKTWTPSFIRTATARRANRIRDSLQDARSSLRPGMARWRE